MEKSFAQRAKDRRESLKQQGICINCGKEKSETNKVKCSLCLDRARQSNQKYQTHNPKAKEVRNRWKTNSDSRNKNRESRKRWRRNFKYKVIQFFGGKCECCLETTLAFLQIDHVNKDGKTHRHEIGRSVKLLRDMLKHPTRYKLRVLCANCHFAITNLGSCPHKENDHGLAEVQQDTALAVV